MNDAARAEVHIVVDRCKGCAICIEICQAEVLVKSPEANPAGVFVPMVRDATACTGCGMCEMLCPDFAIWVSFPETEETPQ